MPRKQTIKKRDDLVEAAVRVFREKGYRDASVKEIAAEAGASTATFYRYFDTKEALYEEIVMGFLFELIGAWAKSFAMLTTRAMNREKALGAVADTFRALLEYYNENREIAEIVFRTVLPVDERFAEQGDLLVRNTLQQIEQTVGVLEANDVKFDVEPRVASSIVIGAVFGVAVICVIQDGRTDVDTLVDQMMTIVGRGMA